MASIPSTSQPIQRNERPFDEQLDQFLQAGEYANVGLEKLLARIKEANPTWALSLTRLRKFRQSLIEQGKRDRIGAIVWVNSGLSDWRSLSFPTLIRIPPATEAKLLTGEPLSSTEVSTITRRKFHVVTDDAGNTMSDSLFQVGMCFPETDTGEASTSGMRCAICEQLGSKERAKAQMWFVRLTTKKFKGKGKSQQKFDSLGETLVDLQIFVQPICRFGGRCETIVREGSVIPNFEKHNVSAYNTAYSIVAGPKQYTDAQLNDMWHTSRSQLPPEPGHSEPQPALLSDSD